MDYLDPKKELQQRVYLMLGYLLTAIAVSLATLILLYQAHGFDLGKNGAVVQNSLTFFSSKPTPADIYLDGKLQKEKTNTRLELPEGMYRVELARNGYRPWQRTIQLDGGKVQHYDYPLLIPKKLVTKKVNTFASAPALVTQSLDRRWLLTKENPSSATFKVTDLKNKPLKAAEQMEFPAGLLSEGAVHSWSLVEWADDNDHLLVKHVVDGKLEYILINRSNPGESLNLTKTLSIGVGELTLKNRKYDQYFLFDAVTGNLQTGSLKEVSLKPVLLNVLSFKSYGDNMILYATNNAKPDAKVQIKLDTGKKTHLLKEFNPGSGFLLDLTTYSGELYVAVGVTAQDRVYVYEDPIGQVTAVPKAALTPIQVMHVEKPNHISFSSSAQFLVAENALKFAVYDFENKKGFNYESTHPIDAPQTFATWMDGNRLTYVSEGKQVIFDYDYTNQRELSLALPTHLPVFSQDYNFVYTLTNNLATPGAVDLSQTSLLTPEDQ